MKRFFALLLFVPFLGACDSTGPNGTAPVELRFATVTSASATADQGAGFFGLRAASLAIPAEGGVYEIEDVRFVVSEFELEGTETCIEEEDDGEVEFEECEFEGGPHLVDLSLDGGAISLGTGFIAEGTYTSLEFEVEDLDSDDFDDDDDKSTDLAAILAELRAVYPDFPAGASMVASGRFVPTTGDPQPFTVYFDAEIEIEMILDPALAVPTDDLLTIKVDPALWFTGLDFLAANGDLVDFELEMEDGFVDVDTDDEDHDDDD